MDIVALVNSGKSSPKQEIACRELNDNKQLNRECMEYFQKEYSRHWWLTRKKSLIFFMKKQPHTLNCFSLLNSRCFFRK